MVFLVFKLLTLVILVILKFFGYPINKAIGSAAAIGFIIALCGAIGFWYSGSILNVKLPLRLENWMYKGKIAFIKRKGLYK